MVFSDEGEVEAKEKLKELKQQNAKRWEKLKSLHAEALGRNEGEATVPASGDDEPSTTSSTKNNDLDDGNPRAFLREVVETHDELVQTKAILEQRLQNDKRKLEDMQFLMQQNLELRAGLHARKEAADSERGDGDDSQESTINTKRNKLQQEHAWLLGELSYVANLIDEDSPSPLWSLERLLRELLDVVWDDNRDGWVLTASTNPIHPKHLELLHECHVIKSHDLEKNLVSLTDYV